jgi:DNA-binding SARP family transcriptional activator
VLHAAARLDLAEDLLPDWPDEGWLTFERENFRQMRMYALEALGERLIAAGRPGEAVAAGLAAVAAEPLRESAHRAVIRAHLAAGNRWAAARQYEQCSRVFREDLGLSPSAELRQLAQA